MPKRNRQTLKESFRAGRKPTELDFENLIDSTINILDDGFTKTPDSGVSIAPTPGKGTLVSFSRTSSEEESDWELSLDHDTGGLSLNSVKEDGPQSMFSMDHAGNVGLGSEDGTTSLHGEVLISGRKGSYKTGEVEANGAWHDITSHLEGCWALEVVAGCGRRGSGRHTLAVATATHCFGNNPAVSKTESWYGARGNRLRFRWVKNGEGARLQVSTKFSYGTGVNIKYHITRLWFEPFNTEM